MKSLLGMMVAAAGCLLLFGGQQAWAQVGGMLRPGIGQVNNPAYSPYLNLFRNAPLYQNYYGLTRPELEIRSDFQNLQQQVSTNDQAISGIQANAGVLTTGHTTRFLNTGRYFLNSTGQGAGRGAARPGAGR